ncbi:putative RING-H2 finger protein ATL36 [Hibiscus syriacus]|uniref:RING-type E3 ubiquitin transferase n=1 Tax=Hibiscus syriacus TaxID=106335 RepID=A0A6A2YCA1_HIBSY|nr:putative RING-H2 finger protein ATL36 [Hibiscus syriacus]
MIRRLMNEKYRSPQFLRIFRQNYGLQWRCTGKASSLLLFLYFVLPLSTAQIQTIAVLPSPTPSDLNGPVASRLNSKLAILMRLTRGLESSVIESFPTFLYSTGKGLKIGKATLECAICLNEFEDDETLRLIPKCSHVFHPDCIDAWLSSHLTCPVCRANLMVKPCGGETITSATVQINGPVSNPENRSNDNNMGEETSAIEIINQEKDIESQEVSLVFPTARATVEGGWYGGAVAVGRWRGVRP